MINKLIQKIIKKNYDKKNHVQINQEMKQFFEKNGEGIYYVNCRQEGKNILSKIIGKFSNEFTHTIAVLYFENSILLPYQEIAMNKSLKEFYKEDIELDKIKHLVIANSFDIGQVCCDFSYYQNRKMTIRKMKYNNRRLQVMLKYVTDRIGQPYDATGLAFYPLKWFSKKLYKIFDSDYKYCSEFVYDMAKIAGIKLAAHDNPSPGDIESYNAFPILFDRK